MRIGRWTISAAVVLALGLGQAGAPAQEKATKPEAAKPAEKEKAEKIELPKCPVSDEPIDLFVTADTPEGPVYFCCADCIKKFEGDPAKYQAKLAAQRAAFKKLPRVQVTCPVSGEKIDKKTSIEQDGQKVYFCCKNCPEKYQKEPAKFKARLEQCYSYQTRCPIAGEPIDPTSYIDLTTGQRIYFCCPGCDQKLLKDPAKYAPKLEAQGVHIDPKRVSVAKGEGAKKEAGEHKGEHEHEHGEKRP